MKGEVFIRYLPDFHQLIGEGIFGAFTDLNGKQKK